MADGIRIQQIIDRFKYKGTPIDKNWSAETRARFAELAIMVHEAGWDWYWTHVPDLRFGLKELGSKQGKVCGIIDRFNSPDPQFRIRENATSPAWLEMFSITSGMPETFRNDIKEVRPPGRGQAVGPNTTREAYWPDELPLEDGIASDGEAQPDDKATPNRRQPKPTNIVLYGPPGTGKTYTTRERCVALIDGRIPDDREALNQRYRALEEASQIAFVTFHQSYGYEDFIEGLRPQSPGDGSGGPGFHLTVKPGVFRQICTLAEDARLKAVSPSGMRLAPSGERFSLEGRRAFKMSLGRAGVEEEIYDQAIEGGYAAIGWGGAIDWSDPKFQNYSNLAARWREQPGQEEAHGGRGDIRQLWCFLTMAKGDLIVVSQGNSLFRAVGVVTGNYYYEPTAEDGYYHRRTVNWLVLPKPLPVSEISETAFTQTSCYRIADASLKRPAIERLLAPQPDTAKGAEAVPDQFVLIIDEINRANISKVFGELITLIEPDKRLGAAEELTVTLPYSCEKFGVPPNLHIIGTMNTADRSIALLDTALRRRFDFEELMPQPQILEMCDGIDLRALLAAINRRIEYYLDREHQIGHAYFLHCRSKSDVDEVMARKIIPLLCEYFFEDFGRVADVLGQTERSAGFFDRVELTERGQSRASWRVKSLKEFDIEAYRLAIGRGGPRADIEQAQGGGLNANEADA